MVNVAGRSKGCATCRRRKVKCDLTLPQCRRCAEMELHCPGPRTGAFFVHTRADIASPPEVASIPSPRRAPDALEASSPKHGHGELVIGSHVQTPSISAMEPYYAGAFDQLFISHFVSSFGHLKKLNSSAYTVNWLDHLPLFITSHSHASVKAAIRSASMLSYGNSAHDVSIQNEAYRWYAKALGDLRTAISRGSSSVSETTVCSAVMLIHFETWASTSPGAWIQHIDGVSRMLIAVGPKSCRDGFMHHVFSHIRLQTFCASMARNRLHPFASVEWMEVPFEVHSKSSFDRLIDALYCVQSGLTVLDALMQSPEESERLTLEGQLQFLTESAMRQLLAWEQDYISCNIVQKASSSTLEHPASIAREVATLNDPDQSYALDLTTIEAASLTSLFHSGSLINSRILSLLHPSNMQYSKTAHQHTKAIWSTYEFVHRTAGTAGSRGLMTILPQLKMATLWGTTRQDKLKILSIIDDLKAECNAFAALFGPSDGYFAHVAAYVESRTEN